MQRVLVALVAVVPAVALGPVDYVTHAAVTPLLVVPFGLSILVVPWLLRRFDFLTPRALTAWIAGSVLLATVSAVTGIFNGMTDEPFTTPRYVSELVAGQNPYTTLLVFDYVQCAGPTASGLVVCQTIHSASYYVYLPTLLVLQVPGLPYKAFTLLAWGATLYLVRGRPWALGALGSPAAALLAANGFNDVAPLALLTLSAVARDRPSGRLAEALALGAKQFAAIVVGLYYLARRRYGDFLITVALTLGLLLPFLVVAPAPVACTAILQKLPSCSGTAWSSVFNHLNYWLWPLWIIALYPGAVTRGLRRARQLLRPRK